MAGASQGALALLSIGTDKKCFTRFQDQSIQELVDNGGNAICGILDHYSEQVTHGIQRYRFSIFMDIGPADLDWILPWVGFVESPTDTFTIDDDFSTLTKTITIDRVAKEHTYANCKVDRAIFRGQKGRRPINLQLDIIAETEAEAASGTFSHSGTPDELYAFNGRSTLDLYGNTEVFDRFVLAIDNKMEAQFNNSLTATSITPTDREIILAVNTPYTSDETALYTNPKADASGGTGFLQFDTTAANRSTVFTFANIKSLRKPPDILGKTEIRLAQTYQIYRTVATKAVVVTSDNTI